MSHYNLLSEKALENLVCSKCDKYVSSSGAYVTSSQVICGRCAKNNDDFLLPLFTENIENYLFPCINRFDGCKELLHCSQVEKHEKICTKNIKHNCTECEYSGNGTQLYHHFKKLHFTHVLEYPVFNIPLKMATSWNFIYRVENDLFLVSYQITKQPSVLKMTVKSFVHKEEEALCQIILTSLSHEKIYLETEFKNVHEVELNIYKDQISMKCYVNTKVGADLFVFKKISQSQAHKSQQTLETNITDHSEMIIKTLIENLLQKLKCSKCSCYVISPIFKCPSNHVICENCYNSYCTICDDIVNMSRAEDLEIFQDVALPCRWNCNNTFEPSLLRLHEKKCPQRRYKCIENWCSWNGRLQDLIHHWHNSVPIFENTHHVYGLQEELIEFYLLFESEIFYCRIDAITSDGRNVHIREISHISPESNLYRVELKLTGRNKEECIPLKLGAVTFIKKSLLYNLFEFSISLINQSL